MTSYIDHRDGSKTAIQRDNKGDWNVVDIYPSGRISQRHTYGKDVTEKSIVAEYTRPDDGPDAVHGDVTGRVVDPGKANDPSDRGGDAAYDEAGDDETTDDGSVGDDSGDEVGGGEGGEGGGGGGGGAGDIGDDSDSDEGESEGDGDDCHAPGTLIAMADGSHKAIEDIQPGDEVLGSRGAVGTPVICRVKRRVDGLTRKIIAIKLSNSDVMFVSPRHKVITTFGPVRASEILPGAEIMSSSGAEVSVKTTYVLPIKSAVHNLKLSNKADHLFTGKGKLKASLSKH